MNASTVSVYAAECAPANIRGGLAVSWQMWTAFGIFVGFTANLFLYNIGTSGWRWELGVPLLPALPIILLVYTCPESPAWYLKQGRERYDLAFQSLTVLRNSPLQAAKELYYIYLQRRQKEKLGLTSTNAGFFTKIIELFSIARNRRATVAAYVVMLAQQLCGSKSRCLVLCHAFIDVDNSQYNCFLLFHHLL